MANSKLPTNVTAGTPDLPGMLNTTHGEVNELSRSTGLRNVTGILANGWTATSVYIERVRDEVTLYLRGLDGTAATSDQVFAFGPGEDQISTGFRPLDGSFESNRLRADDGSDTWVRADNNSILSSRAVKMGGYIRVVKWRTTAGFPSILPGTAV